MPIEHAPVVAGRAAAALCVLLALPIALAAPAAAQPVETFHEIDDEGVIVIGPDGQPLSVSGGVVAPGGPAAAPGSRLDRLRKLSFDRRPSVVLKAWSTPVKAEDDSVPLPPGESVDAAAAAAMAAAASPPEPAAAGDPSAAALAEAARKKAAEAAAQKAAEAKALEREMAAFQRMVTLGEWAAAKTYLASLPPEEGKAGFERMIDSLRQGPPKVQVPPQAAAHVEKNAFAPEDVVAMAAAAPLPLTAAHMSTLGQILRQAFDAGHSLESFTARLAAGLSARGGSFPLDRRQCALLLAGANELGAMGAFLPSPAVAETNDDREGLNLLSRHYLALHDSGPPDERGRREHLESAWRVTQAALAKGEVSPEAKEEALKRAVSLAPRIRKELGEKWLDDSFTTRPERGMEIVATIGASASLAAQSQPQAADARFEWLELQSTAAQALLRAAPERAAEWREPLVLLARNWLKEALISHQFDSSTSRSPGLQRDMYGNFFYWDPETQMQRQQAGRAPAPIKTSKILDVRPSDAWLALLDDSLRPRFHAAFAQLFLKVGEEREAFPYVEGLAAAHPERAKELVDEFLRVWTKNHDMNAERQRSNPYVYMYGFEQRASGIPLTRSKQDRNLADLAEWVARLRKLPVKLDEDLLATAFTSAHSSAEVYRLERVEAVFGAMDGIEPATLAALVDKMRANLLTVWRDPAEQERKNTNRKPQDIEAEVLRGYALARATLEKALARHPSSWELALSDAALRHDENEYAASLAKSSEFASRREAALARFAEAARLYAAAAEGRRQEDETAEPYLRWFYAALGASDLEAIRHDHVAAEREIPLVREAILSLGGERASRHVGLFANTLFTRMGSCNPAVKFRYVKHGLEIAGDHELTREPRKILEYYTDLVTEIRLEARVDGSDRVGHGEPFGLFVDLRHTREIERESGGFGKYLTNQNQGNAFYYNYGRPTEDYRDKFEEAARVALRDRFDVLSVTFNEPTVRSKALPEYGWRVTPYAYLLLEPRGPEVDRVPPLRLDLDFLDTSGYAVLPVESAPVPIDASVAKGDARPCEKLQVVQTLDERQAKDGKLLLEVKATAAGLVPPLESILAVDPAQFDVVEREDAGVSVVKFDAESEETAVTTERLFTLTLRAKEGLDAPPSEFSFGEPLVEVASIERFRYADADLESVGPVVALEARYGDAGSGWVKWTAAAGGLLLLAGAAAALARTRRREAVLPAGRFSVPDAVSPFTVIGLLQTIEKHDGLGPDGRAAIRADIAALERRYFAGDAPEDAAAADRDLRSIAESWVRRAR
jgi:hypothetical protein